MHTLINASRNAIQEAVAHATKVWNDALKVPGLIANAITCIPAEYLAYAFTMVLRASLLGFCPDIEGLIQSTYNQLHRHLAVAIFQFLSSSFALSALDVNNTFANNYELLCQMYNNFVYGTVVQNTRKERRRPGSLTQVHHESKESKARERVRTYLFNTLFQAHMAYS
jgi:hypothetical protein